MENAKSERVAIFIDGSNFYHRVKSLFSVHNKIDFRGDSFNEIIKKLLGGRLLIGVYYYNAPLDRKFSQELYSKQQSFFEELRRLPGWNVILCRLKKVGEGKYAVKGDDIHLAVDMVSFAYENAFDAAILVSGDGDFEPAIERLRKLGKKVENAFFSVSSSSFLKQACNSSILLDPLVNEILKIGKIQKNFASPQKS